VLIPLSVVVVTGFTAGWVVWWAWRRGQFEDLEGPAHQLLMNDDGPAVGATALRQAMRAESTHGSG
jgi:cbb3-type cytochrome oxidase maturation protein